MSQRSRAVYERYYMPAFIERDCKAIYLGYTQRDELVQAVRRLVRHSSASASLTEDHKIEVKTILNFISSTKNGPLIIRGLDGV